MPRGNRHHLPGYLWHITSRCHRSQFLLKFARDRDAWVYWLFEARKQFGLCVLDYNVTSNHIHLVVMDRGEAEVGRSMQLIEGCTGRAYNRRKGRRGSFWEDCYHATAVGSDEHLANCLVYVDLNMVRAGAVADPSQWRWSGYHEIQRPRDRYRIVDRAALCELLGVDESKLAIVHREWINSKLRAGCLDREPQWSEALAVGRRSFVEKVKEELGLRARYRKIDDLEGMSVLHEGAEAYKCVSGGEMPRLSSI